MADMKPREARRFLVKELRRFMIGPHDGEHEQLYGGLLRIRTQGGKEFKLIEQTPYDFYHTGILSPPSTAIEEEEDDQEDQGSSVDQGAGEGIMVMANAAQQSAMGMTFQVKDPSHPLHLVAEWGRYELTEADSGEESDETVTIVSEPGKKWVTKATLRWQRFPEKLTYSFLPLSIANRSTVKSDTQAGLQIQVRRQEVNGIHFITVSAINRNRFTANNRRGSDPRIYQLVLAVSAHDGTGVFVGSQNTARRRDIDFWQQELLYRHIRQFAVGHGCSVSWKEGEDGRATEINTDWIPETEVYKASAAVLRDDVFLELDRLADGDRYPEALEEIHRLFASYSEWIDVQKNSIPVIVSEAMAATADELESAAVSNLEACTQQCNRIEAGLQYLMDNEKAREAFRLANKAMALSMRKGRPENTPKWFPFQLAFILIAIPSLSEKKHVDRGVLDLIWFPTGGGKTEAYLGLSAYTLFYRGLTARTQDEAGGTAIITRYTLRTLTIQQFERTTLAIMACEKIRREHSVLRIHNGWSIGLLVGSGATPKWLNRKRDDDGSVEDLLAKGGKPAEGKLLPLKECPWCDSKLTLSNLEFLREEKSLKTKCSNRKCDFAGEIPIRIVDEDLVEHPPSFVVATIDKFAQLTWEPDLAKLLGRNVDYAAPDLIIQDELHLITDSLGTIAGLYETAIDALASEDGVGPKIIGATATIRRAEHQVKSLFLRESRQFPPSGLEASDSFFYREDAGQPGRLYVGIHAQGRSPKHTLPRVLGSLAQAVSQIVPVSVRDNYWTIVNYFNSLRELGGALVIAEDDVPAYQKTLAEVTGKEYRPLHQKVEMTGQVPHYRIPEILKELEIGLEDDKADREPIDLLLATNMISVGVDVDRLGLMVIAGQPKTTAEYIQASSRVGRVRGSAGLVIILYNWTRPRDRSHYERFAAYHRGFYRFVEAVSVTPFSPRARDRAMSGIVAALIRTMVPGFEGNKINNPEELRKRLGGLLEPVREIILKRVKAIDEREVEDTKDLIDALFEDLENFLNDSDENKFWIRWRVHRQQKQNAGFMLSSDMNKEEDGTWSAMLSMRDTDSQAPLRLEYPGERET